MRGEKHRIPFPVNREGGGGRGILGSLVTHHFFFSWWAIPHTTLKAGARIPPRQISMAPLTGVSPSWRLQEGVAAVCIGCYPTCRPRCWAISLWNLSRWQDLKQQNRRKKKKKACNNLNLWLLTPLLRRSGLLLQVSLRWDTLSVIGSNGRGCGESLDVSEEFSTRQLHLARQQHADECL